MVFYMDTTNQPDSDRCEVCRKEINLCSDEPAIEFEGLRLCSKACLAVATEGDDREEVRLALEAA